MFKIKESEIKIFYKNRIQLNINKLEHIKNHRKTIKF